MYSPMLAPTMDWVACHACGHVFTAGYYRPATLDVIFKSVRRRQDGLSSQLKPPSESLLLL